MDGSRSSRPTKGNWVTVETGRYTSDQVRKEKGTNVWRGREGGPGVELSTETGTGPDLGRKQSEGYDPERRNKTKNGTETGCCLRPRGHSENVGEEGLWDCEPGR